MSSREHRDCISHDEGRAEMMAVPCQIAGIFGAEYKKRVKIGIVERGLGALQTFTQHPLRIKARFPIDGNHSNIGHEIFSSENKNGNPLISFSGKMSNWGLMAHWSR